MLNEEEILKRANELYAEAKLGPDVHYRAPECRPRIASDQVKALLTAIVEAVNARIYP